MASKWKPLTREQYCTTCLKIVNRRGESTHSLEFPEHKVGPIPNASEIVKTENPEYAKRVHGAAEALRSEERANPIVSLGEDYVKLRREKDELEDKISLINLHLEAISEVGFERMTAANMESFRTSEGVLVSLKYEPIPNVAEPNKLLEDCEPKPKEVLAYLNEKGIKPTAKTVIEAYRLLRKNDRFMICWSRLKSETKSCLEEGAEPPPGVGLYIKQSLNVTGMKLKNSSKGETDGER